MKAQNKISGTNVVDDIYSKCMQYKDRVTFFTASPISTQYLPINKLKAIESSESPQP